MGKVLILTFNDSEDTVFRKILGIVAENNFYTMDMSVPDTINLPDISVYPQEYRIEKDGKSILLSRCQFVLLYHLAENYGRVITKKQLYAYAWNDSIPVNEAEVVRYHISIIRKKLQEIGAESRIETIWGIGYRFRPPSTV